MLFFAIQPFHPNHKDTKILSYITEQNMLGSYKLKPVLQPSYKANKNE